jgi:hypothetical protein
MNLRNLRGRVERLEKRKQLSAPVPGSGLWEFIAGIGTADDLGERDRRLLEQHFEEFPAGTDIPDLIEARIAAVGQLPYGLKELPAAGVGPDSSVNSPTIQPP